MTVEFGATYTEPGATVTDNVDADLTVRITGTVDTSTVGEYTLHYNASDNAGNNATEVTRTVTVVDTTAPVISLNGESSMTVEFGATYTELGATVTDNVDADLTVRITGTVDTSALGEYTLYYNASDNASDNAGNNATEVTRTVTVFTSNGSPVAVLDANTTDEDSVLSVNVGITALRAFGSEGTGSGEFDRPSGVAVDATGNIVIGVWDNKIQTCDPSSGTFDCTQFGSKGYRLGQFANPHGVAVDAATGNIIVADSGNNRIQVLARGGVLINDIDPNGDAISVSSFDAISASGAKVIVNSDGSYSYDPIGVTIIQALNTGESLDDTFNYTIVDSNGGTDTAIVTITVFGVDERTSPVAVNDANTTDEDSVLSVNVDTTVLREIGSEVSDLGKLDFPSRVAVDAKGNIVIADTFHHRIVICDPFGVTCTEFGSSGDDLGKFNQPRGVAVGTNGNIVIADSGNNRIQICDPNSGTCNEFDGSGTGLGQFSQPFGVAVDAANGNIVIADYENNQVFICDPSSGTFDCTAIGIIGAVDVAVDADGNIVVIKTDNHQIQICNPSGDSYICHSTFGSAGNGPGEFANPYGVAIDAATGNIIVADSGNNRIQVLAQGGVLINDYDPNGDAISVSSFDTISANGATVNVNSDGSYSYDPIGVTIIEALNTGESLNDTFNYTIVDSNGETDTAIVTITVFGVDECPQC